MYQPERKTNVQGTVELYNYLHNLPKHATKSTMKIEEITDNPANKFSWLRIISRFFLVLSFNLTYFTEQRRRTEANIAIGYLR